MNLKEWTDKNWIRPHRTSVQEVTDLFGIVKRDLETAQREMVADWQFGIAYNAALKLCTILLYASGCRPGSGQSAHYRTINALPLILGEKFTSDTAYLDACRMKRHEVEYDSVGGVTEADVSELVAFTTEFQETVVAWLKKNHPALLVK
jgi:hypothetical protein